MQRVVAALHDRDAGAHRDDVTSHGSGPFLGRWGEQDDDGAGRCDVELALHPDALQDRVARHARVADRQELHELEPGIRPVLGVRLEDVAAGDRVVTARTR